MVSSPYLLAGDERRVFTDWEKWAKIEKSINLTIFGRSFLWVVKRVFRTDFVRSFLIARLLFIFQKEYVERLKEDQRGKKETREEYQSWALH